MRKRAWRGKVGRGEGDERSRGRKGKVYAGWPKGKGDITLEMHDIPKVRNRKNEKKQNCSTERGRRREEPRKDRRNGGSCYICTERRCHGQGGGNFKWVWLLLLQAEKRGGGGGAGQKGKIVTPERGKRGGGENGENERRKKWEIRRQHAQAEGKIVAKKAKRKAKLGRPREKLKGRGKKNVQAWQILGERYGEVKEEDW